MDDTKAVAAYEQYLQSEENILEVRHLKKYFPIKGDLVLKKN